MLAADLFLVSLVLGAGIIGLVIFFTAVFKGLFDNPQAQSEVIFDEMDLRFWRIWETPEQQAERREQHGDPLSAPPGEWGGSR